MRIAIVGFYHETNSFAVEQNDRPDAPVWVGEEVLTTPELERYIGGFVAAAMQHREMELIPILAVNFSDHRGGLVHASVFEHYVGRILQGLSQALPLDGVYFALHGALVAEVPYTDGEACLIRSAREQLGPGVPFVGTYDFHGIYTDWEVTEGLVPFPLDTNPHLDAFERGAEAGECLLAILTRKLHPVTRRVYVPILGPNIGQSTWSHDRQEEICLPLYQLNQLRQELEQTPGVINLTIQGGYGYADTPDTGMCVIATTDGDPKLAEGLACRLARELWARREEIRTVRPIYPVDEGVKMAMGHEELVCLVDLGDDPGSACPADSPVVLESLLRLGARDCALTIRDPEVVQAGLQAGVGATLSMDVGGKIDRRFYKPLPVTGTVKLIDDGRYTITGPTHGGAGREISREQFRDVNVGPRVVLRIGEKIDVIFSQKETGKDRDFFKSAGIVLEEKRIVVVKSNQAHRASFDPIVSATINLATPGVSTVDYATLPYQQLLRPIYPLDLEMEWNP
ncbi:MAG: M81 family metallopeptidase [Anaerolineae bacterium]